MILKAGTCIGIQYDINGFNLTEMNYEMVLQAFWNDACNNKICITSGF